MLMIRPFLARIITAEAARLMHADHPAWRRRKGLRVFRIDTAFNGMAGKMDVFLRKTERRSGRDTQLFLHQIEPGPASRSYGIQVARLAGMPGAVLNHARHALASLEAGADASKVQVDLFAPPPLQDDVGPSPRQAKLAEIDPDKLSPRDALDALYQLKKLL